MQYIIAFLEGIITFISPCLLPMLPIYISYFAGGGERSVRKTLTGSLGFVTGFSIIFVILGALAGTVGSFLREHQTAVNIVSGLIVIFFGLNFLGVFHINLFRGSKRNVVKEDMNFISAMLFGVIFSLGWTPCVGAFLGSALMLASQQGHGLFSGVVSHSGHQSLPTLARDVVGKFFRSRRFRAFRLLCIRFCQDCDGFCIRITAYPNRCCQHRRCLNWDGIGKAYRLGAALFALAWFRPFIRQYTCLKHDLESDSPILRYVEFESREGQLLDLVRDLDVLEALDLHAVYDEANRYGVPEFCCELSAFHCVYLRCYDVPCG